jgi:hypothetical protein
MKRLRRWLCFLGIHEWLQDRQLAVFDIFPPLFMKYKNPTRKCQHCAREEYWLPGYGGSEVGCWCQKAKD